MTQINCHIPITIRITGRLDESDFEQLSQTLVETLAKRIAYADKTIAAQRPEPALVTSSEVVREPYQSERELEVREGYELPSYQGPPQDAVVSFRRRTIPPKIKLALMSRLRLQVPALTVDPLFQAARTDGNPGWTTRLVVKPEQVVDSVELSVELFRDQTSGLSREEIVTIFQSLLDQRFGGESAREPWLWQAWDAREKSGVESMLRLNLDEMYTAAGLSTDPTADTGPRKRYVLLAYVVYPEHLSTFFVLPPGPPGGIGHLGETLDLPGENLDDLLKEEGGAYPRDVAMFSAWLIRGEYIKTLAGLIPATWRTMTDAQLTKYLGSRFTDAELRTMFLEKYTARASVKAQFRRANILAALAIGLIWARENIEEGEWETAAWKIGGSGATAYAFNKLLLARDPAAKAIMRSKGLEYGRWFKGVARGNKFVNFLTRRALPALLLWDLKDVLMSGGYGGPNIPFDLITEIDIDDPSTWHPPDPTLLDLGFNIWYRQKCTPLRLDACKQDVYVSMVEGSALVGLAKVMDIAPHQVSGLRNRIYRVEGDWDVSDFFLFSVVHRRVKASENIIVIGTGEESGLLVSGRGHYRTVKVLPANRAAVELFGSNKPKWVPRYVLYRVDIPTEYKLSAE